MTSDERETAASSTAVGDTTKGNRVTTSDSAGTTTGPSIAAAQGEPPKGEPTKGRSQNAIVFGRFLRHRAAMISLAVLLFVLLLAYSSIGFSLGPLHIPGWWKYDYASTSPILDSGRPTLSLTGLGEHPFGQDNTGIDYFALTMRGVQQSFEVAMIVGLVCTVVGSIIGALAGYYRGWVESVLMRLTDVVITLPLIAVAAVVGAKAGQSGIVALGIVIGLVAWTPLARLVRGEFLALREREFVDAARISGASDARIIFQHILPNALGVIVVNTTMMIAAAILTETALSYIGLGVRYPDTSLGLLISTYQQAFTVRPWLFWWPGLFILVIALTVNFIGDGVRDAYDPRQKRIPTGRAFRAGLRRPAQDMSKEQAQ